MDNEKQELKEYFASLPIEIQKRILSLNLRELILQIPEAQPLQEVQIIAVENEVALVLLGLQDTVELTTNIKYNAEIARDRAEKISKAINQNILIPNQDILEEVFDTTNDTSIETTSMADIVTQQPTQISQPTPAPVTQPQQTVPDDMFAQKMQQPVHQKTEEEALGDTKPRDTQIKRGEANTNPSSTEQIANDPYKETIE